MGDGRGVRAQLLMLALATVLFAPVLAAGEALGQPVGGALAPAGVPVLVGAFVFAVGMQVAGGCGSGTLYHVGAGSTPMLPTLAAFVAGSVLATFHAPFWAGLPSLGEVSLGERLGWPRAVGLQLGVLALLALLSWGIERRRRGAPPRVPALPFAWRRLVQGPWPLAAGGVLLALLNLATLVLAGHPWTITWAFTLWGGKALAASGYDLAAVPFWQGEFQEAALAAPVAADVTSVMDLGLVLGALVWWLGFADGKPEATAVPVWQLLVGGFFVGYGARLGNGCTSGHGICGLGSLQLPSLMAVLTFMATAFLTANLAARWLA